MKRKKDDVPHSAGVKVLSDRQKKKKRKFQTASVLRPIESSGFSSPTSKLSSSSEELDVVPEKKGKRTLKDLFTDLKKQELNHKEEDSGGSDSEPDVDDLMEKELQTLHSNMLYIIENFNKREQPKQT